MHLARPAPYIIFMVAINTVPSPRESRRHQTTKCSAGQGNRRIQSAKNINRYIFSTVIRRIGLPSSPKADLRSALRTPLRPRPSPPTLKRTSERQPRVGTSSQNPRLRKKKKNPPTFRSRSRGHFDARGRRCHPVRTRARAGGSSCPFFCIRIWLIRNENRRG